MQNDEITNYIVNELGKHRRPQDIALAVCEKTNMPWADAQRLVQQIQSTHRQEIGAQQRRIVVILSAASILLGLAFICLDVWTLAQGIMTRFTLGSILIGAGMVAGGIRGLQNNY